MDPNSESRLIPTPEFPAHAYIQTLVYFLGANYFYHRGVYRLNGNRSQFLGFMLVNAFTSFQLAQATNTGVLKHYGSMYNNTLELEHRGLLNQKLRERLLRQ